MSTRNQQSWVAWIALKSFGAMHSFTKKCLDIIKQSLQSLHYQESSQHSKRICWTSAASVIQHEEKQRGHSRNEEKTTHKTISCVMNRNATHLPVTILQRQNIDDMTLLDLILKSIFKRFIHSINQLIN